MKPRKGCCWRQEARTHTSGALGYEDSNAKGHTAGREASREKKEEVICLWGAARACRGGSASNAVPAEAKVLARLLQGLGGAQGLQGARPPQVCLVTRGHRRLLKGRVAAGRPRLPLPCLGWPAGRSCGSKGQPGGRRNKTSRPWVRSG